MEGSFDIKFYVLLLPVFLLDLLILAASLLMLGLPYWFALEDEKLPLVLKLYKEKRR